MKTAVVLFAVAVLAYGLHRVALWAEARGWIFYLRRQPSRSTLGNAFLEVQSLIEPGKAQLVEARKEESAEENNMGEPPESGSGEQ